MARKNKIVGAHLSPRKPLEEAESVGADCVQVFLSDPQGWKKPPQRKRSSAANGISDGRAGEEADRTVGINRHCKQNEATHDTSVERVASSLRSSP